MLKLTSSLIGLLNSYTTLMTELHSVGVVGIDLPETNNPELIASFVEPEWSVIVKNGDYSCVFGKNEPGNLPAFETGFEEAMNKLSEHLFEDDQEMFLADVSTYPNKLAEIEAMRASVLKEHGNHEVQRQTVIAMLVSKWNTVVRWLEDAEVVGVDDDVIYTPTILIDKVVKTMSINSGAIGLELDFNTNSVTVKGTNLTPEAYAEIALKDEGRDDADYHIKEALTNMVTLVAIIANSL